MARTTGWNKRWYKKKEKNPNFICQECINEFSPKQIFWIEHKTHYSLACKQCIDELKLTIYKPYLKEKRKKRNIQKQYFRCKHCNKVSFRDKKENYTPRQLGCSKCSGFQTLEKIRKPRSKK